MAPTKWITRKFRFDLQVEEWDEIIQEIEGSIEELKNLIRSIPEYWLTKTSPEGWTIQQHAGHLWDLEELHRGRVKDFLAQVETLRPADMSNQKTEEAHHNEGSIQVILNGFTQERQHLLEDLNRMPENMRGTPIEHPRLKQPMRPIDMVYFTREHDLHHLECIAEIKAYFEGSDQ